MAKSKCFSFLSVQVLDSGVHFLSCFVMKDSLFVSDAEEEEEEGVEYEESREGELTADEGEGRNGKEMMARPVMRNVFRQNGEKKAVGARARMDGAKHQAQKVRGGGGGEGRE